MSKTTCGYARYFSRTPALVRTVILEAMLFETAITISQTAVDMFGGILIMHNKYKQYVTIGIFD